VSDTGVEPSPLSRSKRHKTESALLSSVVGAQAHGPSDELRVPFADAEALLSARGVSIHAKSCLRVANRARCPHVSEVVIVSGSGYGGVVSRPHRGIHSVGSQRLGPASIRPAFHDPAFACGVRAFKPLVGTWATSKGENHCWGGVGVTWMELWNNLMQYKPSDGNWYTMDNCYQASAGSGTIECTAAYNCNHPALIKDYRGNASAYSIRNSIGYFASHQSATTADFCG
jgi:hypothetical protein